VKNILTILTAILIIMIASMTVAAVPQVINYQGYLTDDTGEAVVILPDYFDKLNTDFRYQLTCIGTFAQAIVDKKIEDNRFVIRTDKPYVEVSWMVTGVRQDVFSKSLPMEVEKLKTGDKQGRFMHPEIFGFGVDKSVDYKNHKDVDRTNFDAENE